MDFAACITSRTHFCVSHPACDIFLSSIQLKTSNPVDSIWTSRKHLTIHKNIPSAERAGDPGDERKLGSLGTFYWSCCSVHGQIPNLTDFIFRILCTSASLTKSDLTLYLRPCKYHQMEIMLRNIFAWLKWGLFRLLTSILV